jgi:hypothetical protein
MKKIELVKYFARNVSLADFVSGKIKISPEMSHSGWYMNLSAIHTTLANEYHPQTISTIDISTCKTAMLLDDVAIQKATLPQLVMVDGVQSYSAFKKVGWTDEELIYSGFAYYDDAKLEQYHG